MCRKRKLSVMILSVCIFATTSIFSTLVYGSSEDESRIIEKAKTVFYSNRDMFSLTEEEFLKEIENRKPNEVLFASSLAKSFSKDIQYIYDLLDAKKTEDDNTIQHVYRRCCANTICSGYTDKFFLTKPYLLDKSILKEEDNVGINIYMLSEGIESIVKEIEIEREYIFE